MRDEEKQALPFFLRGSAYAANNPVRYTDLSGRDIWIEGKEPWTGIPGHQSICIGSGPGDRYAGCFTFGMILSNPLGGVFYHKPSPGAPIEDRLLTSEREDYEARMYLLDHAEEETRNNIYGWDQTCRGYSQKNFEYFRMKLGRTSRLTWWDIIRGRFPILGGGRL